MGKKSNGGMAAGFAPNIAKRIRSRALGIGGRTRHGTMEEPISRAMVSVIAPTEHRTLDHDALNKLELPEWQRWPDQTRVTALRKIAEAKGDQARMDPPFPEIHVCRRMYDHTGPRGIFFVADGQTRLLAALEAANRPCLRVAIYNATSSDEEKQLFNQLNDVKALNTGRVVHTWVGGITDLLEEVEADSEHPAKGRISMHSFRTSAQRNINASVAIKGIVTCLSGSIQHAKGAIRGVLAKADKLTAGRDSAAAAKTYLALLAHVSMTGPKGPPFLLTAALAKVAHDRWEEAGKPYIPGGHVLRSLRSFRCDTITRGSYSRAIIPAVEYAISERWPRDAHKTGRAKKGA